MTWRKASYKLYRMAQGVLAPGLRHSQLSYADELAKHISPGCYWLELGCGHEMLRSWSISSRDLQEILSRPALLAGVDVCFESVVQHKLIANKACADVTRLPFRSDLFDVIAANMVVEHIGDPQSLLEELQRVLKPGGIFIFHTTNRAHYMFRLASLVPQKLKNKVIWLLQRRHEEDVFPTRYMMNSPRQIQSLARNAGFRIGAIDMLESEPMTIALGPLVIIELLVSRLFLWRPFARFRSNIIAVLEKSPTAAFEHHQADRADAAKAAAGLELTRSSIKPARV